MQKILTSVIMNYSPSRKYIKTIFIQDGSNNKLEIPIDKFQKFFYVAYCITTHKSQGSTFNHGYTIHEYDKFDSRLKYVALSRSTDIKNINIV